MAKAVSFEDLMMVAKGSKYIKPVNINGTLDIITGKYLFIKYNAHKRTKIDLLRMEHEPESIPVFINIDWGFSVEIASIFSIDFVIVDGEHRVLGIKVVQE